MGRPARSPKADIDRILHALADPTRRRMIEALAERPHTVSSLSEPFKTTLTAVSQHLRILEEAGLVRSEKLGRVRSCRIDAEGLGILQQWIADRRSLWERRLDQLDKFLGELD
ncbi:ArsR/SmtB family transcription factor [Sphingomonas sp. ASY06-1R]|jgi:DNA-binding transcriptional ArsR family regulator|uniref:ArsR/SmtB family transcription factor n=1 Tax=Sphingomonas sp. ASY06-1R TaxID=3445771 RepID=UPI003FA22CC5